jgi:serpin B
VYFLGAWQEAFDPRWTVEMPFHLPSGEHTMAQFMSRTSPIPYFSNASMEMVELPYGNGRFGMLILLPRRDTGIQMIEKKLDAAQLQGWIAKMKERNVSCQIPRWRTSSSIGLGKPLFNMGMQDAFSVAADFSRMSPSESLFISKVLHQAAIDVSEKGTEASAATAVMLSESLGGPESLYFRADRPFVYFIRERESGLILFAGRLVEPEQ